MLPMLLVFSVCLLNVLVFYLFYLLFTSLDRNDVRSHCLSDERTSSDSVSHSSGHLHRSVAVC
jgi:hypothetical protein